MEKFSRISYIKRYLKTLKKVYVAALSALIISATLFLIIPSGTTEFFMWACAIILVLLLNYPIRILLIKRTYKDCLELSKQMLLDKKIDLNKNQKTISDKIFEIDKEGQKILLFREQLNLFLSKKVENNNILLLKDSDRYSFKALGKKGTDSEVVNSLMKERGEMKQILKRIEERKNSVQQDILWISTKIKSLT